MDLEPTQVYHDEIHSIRLPGMHDEFRDIKSARQIPLFKGDQWEITVPALLQV